MQTTGACSKSKLKRETLPNIDQKLCKEITHSSFPNGNIGETRLIAARSSKIFNPSLLQLLSSFGETKPEDAQSKRLKYARKKGKDLIEETRLQSLDPTPHRTGNCKCTFASFLRVKGIISRLNRTELYQCSP